MKRILKTLSLLAAALMLLLLTAPAARPALAEGVAWTEVNSEAQLMTVINNSSAANPCYIRLTATIETTGPIVISDGNAVTIDLNGHDIDRNLTTEDTNGCVITVWGSLTLEDSGSGGKITGGYRQGDGGGVAVANGTFTMKGGAISGNRADGFGGGVAVASGTFNMQGGAISNNQAAAWAGGVYGAFTAQGGATVMGNNVNGSPNNVYLAGQQTISVTGALTGEIGVTTDSPRVFAQGDGYTLRRADVEAFRSDDADYTAGLNGSGEAYLGKPFTVEGIDAQEYKAEALTPVVTVTDGNGTALTENTDYAVTLPDGRVDAGKYVVSVTGAGTYAGFVDQTFTIKPKEVTVSGIAAADKVYDGTTDAALDCSQAELGAIGLDELTVAAKGTFADANAGEKKTVKLSGYALGGAAAKNYALAGSGHQAETTATITPAPSKVAKAPTGKALKGNGQAQALVEAGVAESGRMLYALTLTDAAPGAGAYAEALPTAAAAGEYYVWYKAAAGDANHADSEAAFVKASISEYVPVSIFITPSSVEPINVNSKVQLTVQASDPTFPLNDAQWASMNTAVATVSKSGTVTGRGVGTTAITVTAGGLTASVNITVKDDAQPASIRFIDGTPTVVELKNTLSLAPYVALGPDGAKSKLSWFTSDKKVATVSSSGVVTGKAAGTATISVRTANNLFADLDITVRDYSQPSAVWFSADAPTVIEIKAKVDYSSYVVVDPGTAKRKFTWYTSNKKVATVSSGKVTAKAAGTATITVVTSNNLHADLDITVKDLTQPDAVRFADGTPTSVEVKNTVLLASYVALEPSGAKTKLTWSTSNRKVAAVSSSGKVTGKAAGTATITVRTSNGLSAELLMTVRDAGSPSGVTLTCPVPMPVSVKQRVQLVAAFEPAGINPKKVKWTSSNTKVATVTQKGVLTGKKDGTTVVTVTAGGVYASIEVAVKDLTIPTGIRFADGAPTTLYKRQRVKYKPYVILEPGTAKTTLKWKSSDRKVVTVSSGQVTAKGPGTATLTVTTKNGLSASIALTVTE